MGPLETAIVQANGLSNLARSIGVSVQALHHWRKRGMPRTEWTGETDYAKRIERATKVRASDLLTASKQQRAA